MEQYGHRRDFQVAGSSGFGSNKGLITAVPSNVAARTWDNASLEKDVQVQADVLVNNLGAVQIFARGQNLNQANATYYAVSVGRGMEVDLLRVINGQTTKLATIKSTEWTTNVWARVNLTVQGDQLSVQVFRTDTAQYLDSQRRLVGRPS